MDYTQNLKLQYIYSHQSQKEIVINNNFKKIDDLFNNAQNTTIPQTNTSIDNISIVVSASGNIVFNKNNSNIMAGRLTTGKYRVTMQNGKFNNSAPFSINAYTDNTDKMPYITNIALLTEKIDINIFYYSTDKLLIPADMCFCLTCNSI